MLINNLQELLDAINNQEPNIIINQDFEIDQPIEISYPTTIRSNNNTLTRASNYTNWLFHILANVTFQNITLDGNGSNIVADNSIIYNNSFSDLFLDNVTIQNGNTTYHGTALYNAEEASCQINNCLFQNNISATEGGAIYHNTFGSLNIKDSTFTNNEGTNGAAVQISSRGDSSNTTITNSTFYANNSTEFYGAVTAYFNSIVSIDSCIFTGNKSSYGGAGLSIADGPSCTVQNSRFENNESNVAGGGVFVFALGSVTNCSITKSEFINNTSLNQGGGLHASGKETNLTLQESTFSGNNAYTGGGMYLAQVTTGNITDNHFQANNANLGGAGVLYGDSDYLFDNNQIINNTASRVAGIFFSGVNTPLNLTINNNDFIGNTATSECGGLGIINANIEISNSTFNNNQAQSGGAILQYETAILTIQNSDISSNKAIDGNGGGILSNDLISIDNVQFTENTASNEGGCAAFVNTGNITIKNADFERNEATNGGSIFVSDTRNMNMSDSTFSNNNASNNGGGIYIKDNSSVSLQGNVTMNNNSALHGKDIYNNGYLEMAGVNIVPDGVYMEDRENVIYISNSIAGSTIQLENSPYVHSAPNNSPIIIGQNTNGYPSLSEEDNSAFVKPTPDFNDWLIRRSDDNTQILLILPDEFAINYHNLYDAINLNPSFYTENTLPIILQDPIRTGYDFLGWFDENGNRITEIPIGTTGDLNLYASWDANDHVLNFNGNDSPTNPATNVPDSVYFEYNDDVTIPNTIPQRPGFIFINWNTSVDGTGITHYPNEILQNLTDDLTLHAQWYQLPRPQSVCCCPTEAICVCCKCRYKIKDLK